MSKFIRKTKQREIILEELCKLTSHPTADELYFIVKEKLPNISLGTVYRNLEFMSQEGMIKKIEVRGKLKRFDGNTEKHFHMRCVKCDRIFDLFLDDYSNIDSFFNNFKENDKNFQVLDYDFELNGLCENCQNG
jgi:Fur family ferric uptake transcriptional regulator